MGRTPHRRPSRRSPAPRDSYPWAREREALEALERLEIDRCRGALKRLAAEIAPAADMPPAVAALLLNGALARLDGALNPTPSRTDGAGAARLRRAERLGSATDLNHVRAVFLDEVEAMFAPLAAGSALSPGVRRARAYLDQHFTRRVTLRQLAEAVHLSPNYLSSIFRRETGMTVTEYLRARRLRLAERLLLEGDHTISEVAYRVGYQNYRDFHRNFVRAGGRSPRAFQRLTLGRRRSSGDDRGPGQV